ncbi:MAG: hypothetical protein IPL28_09785 [Chloroflexi bacterium]|nr:hypothetical protein [Chloroflexota bacterium]
MPPFGRALIATHPRHHNAPPPPSYTYSISDDKFFPNPLTTIHRNNHKPFLANDITRFAPCSPF